MNAIFVALLVGVFFASLVMVANYQERQELKHHTK